MADLRAYLEKKVREIISTWNEADIYAVSFFVHSNEAYEYKGHSNVTEFCVSYNTESDCADTGELSEERWNYAFWRQNEIPIIEADNENEGMKILFEWYEKKVLIILEMKMVTIAMIMKCDISAKVLLGIMNYFRK